MNCVSLYLRPLRRMQRYASASRDQQRGLSKSGSEQRGLSLRCPMSTCSVTCTIHVIVTSQLTTPIQWLYGTLYHVLKFQDSELNCMMTVHSWTENQLWGGSIVKYWSCPLYCTLQNFSATGRRSRGLYHALIMLPPSRSKWTGITVAHS